MKVRIKDIADRAGVSIGTVDRVIHNRGEVSGKTHEKVMGILSDMHYEPDILARTLASRNPMRVAVLIPYHTPENWFWQEPLNGINDAVAELNHFRIELKEFLYDQFSKDDFVKRSEEVIECKPDAVIAAPVFYREMNAFIGECTARNIPFVSVNENTGHPDQLTYIGQDARQSGAVAASLLKSGITANSRILVISITRDRVNNRHILQREEGFTEYWSRNGNPDRIEIIQHAIESDQYRYIRDALAGLFKKHTNISGIFITNSRVYQVAKYLETSGRKDIRLVGYDLIAPNIKYLNSGMIDFLISQKPREQGYQALISIFNRLKMNRKPNPEQLIPIDIICKENLCCYQV